MPRFAANLTMMFNEVPLLDRFAAAADAGFREVELLFPYEHDPSELQRRTEDAGVRFVLINLPPGDWAAGERGLAALPNRSAEFSHALQLGLRYARVLHVPRVHLMAGIVPADDAVAHGRYLDALREACELLGLAGIDVLIEPLNGRDMPGYFLDDFDRAAAIIAELDLPNLKLQYDIYHRQILHGDVLRSLEALLPIVGHVQVASVPLRQEPGTGELDDFAVFAALDRLGYNGSVGCEYRPAAGTLAGLSWRNRLASR